MPSCNYYPHSAAVLLVLSLGATCDLFSLIRLLSSVSVATQCCCVSITQDAGQVSWPKQVWGQK